MSQTLAQRVTNLERRAVDPNLTANVETDAPNVRPANPTHGPHRITFVVPNPDDTVVSFGRAFSKRINDDGITGRTKTHVHWHTTVDATKTMAALGGCTNEGWAGQGGNNLAANQGFMVVTEANTWVDANKQLYLVSRTSDATLRAVGAHKRVMIQADAGEIDMVAKVEIQQSAPLIALMAPATITPNVGVNYTQAWEGEVPKASGGKVAKWWVSLLAALISAHDLGLKAKKTFKKWRDGKLHADEDLFSDVVKWGLDAAKFGITAGKLLNGYSSPAEPGSVKIGGDADVSALAGRDVSLFGARDCSAGGGIWAGLSAGVGVSVKATAFAGVGSLYTSLKGYRKVEMASDYGKVSLKADKDVVVSAENAAVSIGAKTNVGITASTGSLFSGAADKLHIVVGSGAGTGIVAKETELWLGMVTSANEAKSAAPKTDSGLKMDGSQISCFKGAAGFRLMDNKFSLFSNGKAGELLIDGSNVTVEGSRICLG